MNRDLGDRRLLGQGPKRRHQPQIIEHGRPQVLGHPVHLLERLFQRSLDRLQLLAGLGVARPFEEQVEADDLVGECLASLIVQLPGDPLPFPFLGLQDALRAQVALVLHPIEHRVEDIRDPPQIGVVKVGMDARLVEAGPHRAHRRFQLPHRFEGQPKDQEVRDQDGDQPDREQPHQERQPRAPGEIQRDQRATDGAGGNDGAIGHNHLLKGGQVPMPPPRVQRGSHSSF